MKRSNIFSTGILIILTISLLSCNNKSQRHISLSSKDSISTEVAIPIVRPNVNVYIENSGSMDGYVNGNTEFKGAIRDLLVLLKHYYGNEEKIKVHFINNRIRQTDTQIDLATFATNINQLWRVQGEDRGSSNLNNVFKMILDKTDKETISILFSDCIYSIQGRNAEGLLSDEKSLTKDAFLTRWRQDSLKLATTIVKMKSMFTGTYFDKDNVTTNLSGDLRPYYICVIGNNDVMSDFNRKIPLEKDKIEGFDKKYIISTGTADELYYSVLLRTENVGRFKASRKASTKEHVHGIEDIDMKSRNRDDISSSKFTFAVAVDLNNVPVEEDYLLGQDNYTLGDNNFHIKDIKSIDKNNINASDWVKISESNPTHLIILEATGSAISDVKVSLKKQMPQWIEQTNIIDDKNIKNNLDKTFGIKYMIEGITEAYQIIYPEDNNFFEFEVKINN
ncbi:MAG TPA: hypothetical protein PLC80_00995 [Draconibacterium sp.]|nr:hypothetical protein [Draconibacterium sp.]